jgi:N-alpha-acetyltransferase 40
MKALEKLAKIWSMELVVLTLLTNNEGATRFYKRLGYSLDETSPSKDEETNYEILSKSIF